MLNWPSLRFLLIKDSFFIFLDGVQHLSVEENQFEDFIDLDVSVEGLL